MQRNLLTTLTLSVAFLFGTALPALAADTTPPSTGNVFVSVDEPMAGTTVWFYVNANDDVRIASCQLFLMPSLPTSPVVSEMSLQPSGSYRLQHTFPENTVDMVYGAQARCYDAVGNSSFSPDVKYFTVHKSSFADTTPPNVGNVSVNNSEPLAGSSIWVYIGATDNIGITSCRLILDGNDVGLMNPQSSGSYAVQYSFPQSTVNVFHSIRARCYDAAGNSALSLNDLGITVHGYTSPNDVAPTVGPIQQTAAITGVATTLRASVSGAIAQCNLWVDGANKGGMTVANGVASINYVFSTAGNKIVGVECFSPTGTYGQGTNVTMTVSNPTGDVTPTVGAVQQVSAASGVATSITAPVSGSVSQCTLYVNNQHAGPMNVWNGLASTAYVFGPSASVRVECMSPGGRIGIGPTSYIATRSQVPGQENLVHGTLLKLSCPSYAGVDHPCKSVYYFGADGKRHPFPNSKIFFTWYADFSNVIEVSDAQMAAIPLGSNVRYRPGVKMVKFTTDPKVYAVAGNGTLRWITTEALARSFYTPKWNGQIDDIPDTFYTSYSFGANITDVGQYNPVGETNMASSIDLNL